LKGNGWGDETTLLKKTKKEMKTREKKTRRRKEKRLTGLQRGKGTVFSSPTLPLKIEPIRRFCCPRCKNGWYEISRKSGSGKRGTLEKRKWEEDDGLPIKECKQSSGSNEPFLQVFEVGRSSERKRGGKRGEFETEKKRGAKTETFTWVRDIGHKKSRVLL